MKSDALLNAVKLHEKANQRQKAKPNQVKNNAGGFVFKVDPMTHLRRFLVLGTTGGTYYQGEQELSAESVQMVQSLMQDQETGLAAIMTAVQVSGQGLAPKNNPALFVIAAGAASEHVLVKQAAYQAMPHVARTFTHLAIWMNYVGQLKGGYAGMGLRKALQRWYLDRSSDQVAYQMVKYRQRESWTHRDVLRLAKPQTTDPFMQANFAYVTDKFGEHDGLPNPPQLGAFIQIQEQGTKLTPKQAVDFISEYNLPWETLPDHVKNDPSVWATLLPGMGATALIRQLPTLTRVGVVRPGSKSIGLIMEKLADQEFLTKGRVHPFNVLVAMKVYASGKSLAGSSTWSPVSEIVDALEKAYYLTFGNVPTSGKRIELDLDVSGSMKQSLISSGAKDKNGNLIKTPLNAREASAAMAMVTLMAEEDVSIYGFVGGGPVGVGRYGRGRYGDSAMTSISIERGMTLSQVVQQVSDLPFGRTDCSLPMVTALEQKRMVDVFVIYTDNETWAGKVHPYKALEDYRKALNPEAKLVVMSMTATPFSIANPDDPGMLDIVGLDTSAPNLISAFASDEF